jgi:CRP/FNR family transcriptional regulator, cyclic AMP receptor protein
MVSPDRSETLDNILIKQLRSEGFVCSLPSRTILFMEDETPQGIHIIARGHVKLSISSSEGRVFIIRVTEPGEILGLHNCITGAPYEMTAQTLQSSRVGFVKREDVMRVLRHSREACLSAVEQLGRTCHLAYSQVSSFNLSHSVSEKLARFLLSLSAEPGCSGKDRNVAMPVDVDLTHDEIAQAIGTSRETVTRALASFRNKHWANLTGSMLLLQNRAELEKIAGVGTSSEPAVAASYSEKRGPVSVAASRPLSAHRPARNRNGKRSFPDRPLISSILAR